MPLYLSVLYAENLPSEKTNFLRCEGSSMLLSLCSERGKFQNLTHGPIPKHIATTFMCLVRFSPYVVNHSHHGHQITEKSPKMDSPKIPIALRMIPRCEETKINIHLHLATTTNRFSPFFFFSLN